MKFINTDDYHPTAQTPLLFTMTDYKKKINSNKNQMGFDFEKTQVRKEMKLLTSKFKSLIRMSPFGVARGTCSNL